MRNEMVGIMMANRPALLVGILAVLRSRNGFIPISPLYPAERIHFIIRDCRLRVLLIDQANLDAGRRIAAENPLIEHLVCLDRRLPGDMELVSMDRETAGCPSSEPPEGSGKNVVPHPEETCYVIYTSGSTGRPKGVPVKHQNLAILLTWFRDYFRLGEHTRVLQNLSYSFDFGVFEILTTLLFGGSYHCSSRQERTGIAASVDQAIRFHINTLHTTPTFFTQIVSLGRRLPEVKILHFGGEELGAGLVERAARLLPPDGVIFNGYGPTEATINTSIFSIKAGDALNLDENKSVPIGRPSARHRVFILNRHLHPCPVGVYGELYIGGPGLSAGYLNNPELTAEKFIVPGQHGIPAVPIPATGRLYRTGDLCRFRPDGGIEFLGRVDDQVKIRGYRIELGEIEKRLSDLREIRAAVVLPRQEGDRNQYLAAYVVLSAEAADGGGDPADDLTASLRRGLLEKLPDYMIPAYFVPMKAFPMTPGGKVDRRSLPEPKEAAVKRDDRFTAPRDEVERQIASIWESILEINRIGIDDDFFELGGDSIMANRVIARMREELATDISLRSFFENPCIRGLAPAISRRREDVVHILRASRGGKIPLSFSQERLWFLQQLDQESRAYHVPRALRIKGQLDIPLFERTFTEIIRRHEILRTVFITVDGKPVQQVQPPFEFTIPVVDWRGLPAAEQRRRVKEFVKEEGSRVFDFERGPLIRMTLLRLQAEESILVSSEHHLVHDGWTQGVMLKEFMQIYQAFRVGSPSPLPELPIQYGDYAVWQRSYMSGERLKRYLDFWQRQLADLPPLLELPADHPRPPVMTGRGTMDRLVLRRLWVERLERFGNRRGMTMFMTMLAAFKVLLYRYTGREDLWVGTGIANRRSRELEGMLGMVINTLVLRTWISGDMTFEECLHRVKETCLQAYEYEETPFEKVVEMMRPSRNLSYPPLVQVMFSFMDTPTEGLRLPGLVFSVEKSHNLSAKFDLNVVVIPPRQGGDLAGEILIDWEYNTDIFRDETMQRMQAHYLRLLEVVTGLCDSTLSALPMLGDEEIHRLLYTFNETVSEYPEDETVHQLVEERAHRQPDGIALADMGGGSSGEASLTYGELNRISDQWAALLRRKGCLTESIVGIMAQRSTEMIGGVLGILKAGGVYLPIAPEYPEERVDYMLENSRAEFLIVSRILSKKMTRQPEIVYLELENRVEMRNFVIPGFSGDSRSRNLAYIIYTSGTTGKPKGTLIRHRSLVNLCSWHIGYYRLTETDRVTQYASSGFDASVWEIFPCLCTGSALYIIPHEIKLDMTGLNDCLERYCITIAFLPTPVCRPFMALENRSLRILLTGGDKLQHYVRRGYGLYNNYGPTESTVVTTVYPVEVFKENIPIGKPIANTRIYILDKKNLHLQPVGVPGELFIAGDGLSSGYLGEPELTERSFIVNPHIGSERIYRTGDRARWLADGNIEFLGRLDLQLKIRGFRIEPEEIQYRLENHDKIKRAFVTVRSKGSGDKYLCVYYVADTPHSVSELREYLAARLPAYMIPACFIRLDRIPLNPSGKVDRQALPEPATTEAADTYIAPRDETEKKLVEIWSGVLEVEPEHIGIHADFFDLGGHSLMAALLVFKIHRTFNVKVPLAELFVRSRLGQLAGYIKGAGKNRFRRIDPSEKREYYKLSSAQKRLFFLDRMETGKSTVYNLPGALLIKGRPGRRRFAVIFKKLVTRHESFRTSFGMVMGEPVQFIHGYVDFDIKYSSVESASSRGTESGPGIAEEKSIIREFIRPFDLGKAPLLRIELVRLEDTKYLLLMDMHHIIADGVSLGILVREFVRLDEGDDLPELRLQYRDFQAWQHDLSESREMKKQAAYWIDRFDGPIPVLSLATDYPRPSKKEYKGEIIRGEIRGKLANRIRQTAMGAATTPFTVLLTAFTILLARYSGQEDIIIGVPSAGRNHGDLGSMIGMFVNTLPVRNYPGNERVFKDFLSEVKESVVEANENQDYPLEELVNKIGVSKDLSRNPLFDVLFVSEEVGLPAFELKGLEVTAYPLEKKISHLDLVLYVKEAGPGVDLILEYATALFSPTTAGDMLTHYVQILEQSTENGEIKLEEIKLSHDLLVPRSDALELMGTGDDFEF